MPSITVDTKALEAALGGAKDQMPFAVSKALNDLTIRIADVQRADMRTRFTIRNENVLKYGIVRTEKATKQSLAAAVGVSQQSAGNREAFGYLKKFEKGGSKRPVAGSAVAVPVDARRSKRGIVTASNRIPALQLKKHGRAVQGIKRTFMIQPKSGRAAALILQQVGRGKRATNKVLYVLERSVPIQPMLHLMDNATRTAKAEWQRIAGDAVALALRTMRRP
jgi:hypothetical protein